MFRMRQEAGISIYGDGGIGGKGEGLVKLAQMKLRRPAKLRTRVLSTEFYSRFRDSGRTFDREAEDMLREVHASFKGKPMSVRPSERDENNPEVATSGENTSFMLPNNHPSAAFDQFLQAIRHIFRQFEPRARKDDGIAVVVNDIHGVRDRTRAGEYFYPMSSGVADSFFRYPVASKRPEEGFARIAFGHGYATVRTDFDVLPVLTIENPERPSSISRGQRYFFAIDMSKNQKLEGRELETMSELNVSHAHPDVLKHFSSGQHVDFDRLLEGDDFGYASNLKGIMEDIGAKAGTFQIEFTFNIIDGKGVFHIVQFKDMREPNREKVTIPDDGKEEFISTDRVQGNGVIRGIRSAIVINPINYRKGMHAKVKQRLRELNGSEKGYLLICPGRLGTSQREWGMDVDFKDISNAMVLVEYGYDITGRPDIPIARDEMTGGVYGSHFLYQLLGGAREAERVRQLRMLGSQGTHFITNLISTGAIYLHIDPTTGTFDPWFFEPPEGEENSPVYVKRFEQPVTAYADLFGKRCVIK